MSLFDSIVVTKPTAPTDTPKGGVFSAVNVQAPQPMRASSVFSAPAGGYTPFQGYEPSGAFVGISDKTDPYSSRPYFAYKLPGQATTTDMTRTAPAVNPEVAAPTDKAAFENPRMPESASQKIRVAQGATPTEQLDHRMALALGGSNDTSNLKLIPTADNQAASKLEGQLPDQIAAGDTSLFDAQKQEAAAKGLATPWTDEQGKTLIDHVNDVLDGIQTVENKVGITSLKNWFEGIANPTVDSATQAATDLSQTVASIRSNPTDVAKWSGQALGTIADTLGTLVGAASAGFSALGSAASKVPVLSQANDAVNWLIGKGGEGGSAVGGTLIDHLPVTQAVKDDFKAPLQKVGSLAGQLLVGGLIFHELDTAVKAKGAPATIVDLHAQDFKNIANKAGAFADALAKKLPATNPGGFVRIPGLGDLPEEGDVPANKKEDQTGEQTAPQDETPNGAQGSFDEEHGGYVPVPGEPAAPARNIAELKDEITQLKDYIQYSDETVATHPAKELLKYFGGQDPTAENLDDIFAKNVERGTGAKVSKLDSIVTEHGYETPKEAHQGVLDYIHMRDQNKDLHEQLQNLNKEYSAALKTTKEQTVAERTAAATEHINQKALEARNTDAYRERVRNRPAVQGLRPGMSVDRNGVERIGRDPLANASNFHQRIGELRKLDPERSLNAPAMHHISSRDMDALIQRQKDIETAKADKIKAREESSRQWPYTRSFIQKLKSAFYPVHNLPDDIRTIAEKWRGGELEAAEKANQSRYELPGTQTKIAKDGTREIIKKSPLDKWMPTDEAVQHFTAIQHGKFSPLRPIFDSLYHYAEVRGLDVPYRKNYLPQWYKEPLKEVKVAMVQYMRDHGVDEEAANGYVEGVMQLPDDVSKRLKISPSFEQTKVFPDYSSAAKYGLHPLFQNDADLVANYVYEMEKSLNNKNFVTTLIDKGKMLEAGIAPEHWEHVTKNFVKGDLYAPPELAKMLNDLYRSQASLGTFDTSIHFLGLISRKSQEIALSGAVPYTNIHFFDVGQLIKEFTAGNFKALDVMAKTNSFKAYEKYWQDRQMYSRMMARQGIDVSSRMGSIRQVYDRAMHDKTFVDKVGIQFKKAFIDKSFGTFLPTLYLQIFTDTYDHAVGGGMNAEDAEKFAGSVTRANFGLLGNEARARKTSDALSAVFFAPVFRESVFGVLANALKSITPSSVDLNLGVTRFKGELSNPAFYRNRRLVGGMVFTFAMYQLFNKVMNGSYTWQNPNGHEFDLRVPLADGNNMYIPFMPSFLALPRAAASSALGFAKGDIKTGEQQASSFFSLPLQTTLQLYANKDYFGTAIYKDTDSAAVKAEKIGQFIGLAASHPFVHAVVDGIEKKQPIYQSLSEAATLPLKFQQDSTIDKGAFYDALGNAQQQNADASGPAADTYGQVQQLLQAGDKAGAQKIVDGLTDDQYKAYTNYKRAQTSKNTTAAESALFGTYQQIQQLAKEGKTDQAKAMVDKMSDADYHTYQLLKNRFGSDL